MSTNEPRDIFIPHNLDGMVDFKGEPTRNFNSMVEVPGGYKAKYTGSSDETVWENFIEDFGVPVIEVQNISGPGLLHFDSNDSKFAVAKIGEPITITATNPGPSGTWSTPVQSPSGIAYATTTNLNGSDVMNVELIFHEPGDWYLTQDLINKDLSNGKLIFAGLHIRVTLN